MLLLTLMTMTGALLAALYLSVTHLPWPLRRALMAMPPWLQALLIHFAYGGWVGGVTGHVLGALLAVPWFVLTKWYLIPAMRAERRAGHGRGPRSLDRIAAAFA